MYRFVMTLLFVLATNTQDSRLDQLARSGKIQEDAPVKACVEITINASREKVWSLLTDIKNWPKWQREISKTEISGPLQSGTPFSWNNRGTDIRSKIALVQPMEQFAWTGKAYQAKAIHVWTLQQLPGERTLVRTDESMDGFLLSLFYSSKKLKEGDQRWLDALKQAAEQKD